MELQGWYYLHTNGDLIYKNSPNAIQDIRESDLCHSAWPFVNSRDNAWGILVEANSLFTRKERIKELTEKWNCNDTDAINYAKFIGIEVGIDGNKCFAHRADFTNIQESPIGYGDTYLDAMSELAKNLGYSGGKMWSSTFQDLVKN